MPNNKELFQKVKDLNFPIGAYAMFGSAPMGIRGIRECHDIDMIVSQKLWDECKNGRGWEVKTNFRGSEYFEVVEIEIWNDWGLPGVWDIEKMIREAEIIDGLPFVKLEYVLQWKKLKGREKDLQDIAMINNYLQPQKVS